jgi:hypothetical protein
MSDADVALVFGHGGSSDADEVERAALVAALLSSFTARDAPLVRELTRREIAAVRDADSGCGVRHRERRAGVAVRMVLRPSAIARGIR